MDPAQNQLLSEVGRETPMGRLLRRYWAPVLRSARVKPGGDPVPFQLFGERLVAFRAPDGKLGIRDEACPHRGASLAIGRNEDGCLRCLYHGWSFDTDGNLVEAPTHPPGARIDRLRVGVRPAREDSGMIWTWLGKGEAPPLPRFAFSGLPDDQILSTTGIVEANWVQMMESLWDTFHAQILHNRTNRKTWANTARMAHYFSKTPSAAAPIAYDLPTMSIRDTEFGFFYTATDEMKDLNYAWIMPWYVHHTVGPSPLDDKAVQIHVPIDDQRTLFWQVMYNAHGPLEPDGYARRSFTSFANLDNFREEFSKAESWKQARDLMASGESFTGVAEGRGALQILMEDIVMAESQGRIDRSQERLAPTDVVVVKGRKTLLEAVAAHERGEAPLGLDADVSRVEAVFSPKQATRDPAVA